MSDAKVKITEEIRELLDEAAGNYSHVYECYMGDYSIGSIQNAERNRDATDAKLAELGIDNPKDYMTFDDYWKVNV